MHIGSQLTTIAPFIEAVEKVAPFVAELKAKFGISYFSIGGGIGIVYKDALASGAREWWDAQPADQRPLARDLRCRARAAAPAARLENPARARALSRRQCGRAALASSTSKRGAAKNFLVLDAAMNDLVRPAMYDAHHEIVPLHRDTSRRALVADVVGPICESGDCFARDRQLQEVGEGEFVAFMSAGAYGFTMASRYNTRSMPAEVLVHGSAFELVNARETFEQMIAHERIPAFLK